MAGASVELPEFLDFADEQSKSGDNFHRHAAEQLTRYPVSIREFIESPDFLNDTSVYPANMEALTELNNPHGLRIGTCYTEAVIAGAIGVGKSTISILSLLYQIYVLSCLSSPQKLFDLSANSEIVFVVQAPTERLAKAVGYSRMRELVLQSPYFAQHHKPDKRIKSELRFPNGVVLRPLSGSDTAALGQNVLGGLLDEVAFAEYTERSARTRDREAFDQAERQYNAIAMRRKSRFLKKGRLPGLLCLVSSPQYPDDLIERKIRQAHNDPAIFLYQLRLWDVKPDNYGEERFSVFTGDDNRPPRLLSTDENFEADMTDSVPIEFNTLDAYVAQSVNQPQFYTQLFSAFALMALVLAGVGVYGTMSYTVGQRTRELGIRLALGAEAGQVTGMVARQGLAVAGVGLVGGLIVAGAGARIVETFLFGVSVRDPFTYLAGALVLGLVAVAACWIPARRAGRSDPMRALRME